MNTYPSSTPSPPRPPPLVVSHALAARGANPPGPMDLTSSREEVLPTRTGLATISTVAAPPLEPRLAPVSGIESGRSLAAQFIVSVALTFDGAKRRAKEGPYRGQTELEICLTIGIMNWIWFIRTVLICFLLCWFPESMESDDPICPLDIVSIPILMAKSTTITIWLFVILSFLWLGLEGKICRDHAPHIFALMILILSVIALHYALQCCIWTYYAYGNGRSRRAPSHLTRAEVDRIALVHYIPPSADEAMSPVSPASPTSPTARGLYPPRSPVSYWKKTPRFILFRSRSSAVDGDIERDAGDASWGRPEVRLPDNLARCAICLEDFEAPPGVVEPPSESGGDGDGETHEMTRAPPRSVMEMRVRVEPETRQPEDFGVADAGGKGAPMPLRLLGCGHAFHKECIDPWLLKQAAARCPNCRMPVQVPQPATKRWGSWRNATA
ncbi:uncharacterized protein TRAVEDRAFT_54241 [Trametes versicolor FP-101664 SS1]|uniref:RING-type domain-containing protein n=1 Tax=Trametes versicolor (strain FP-101664) TaxID=717944 RepID=R7S7Z1_TRAVS|nr:uncharacterized protein TRAVEDRAFT_54241 [Trametes versicolor FP-101664 SS1]EIW51815.1 hypothetical protein TRAVEDRAFT_54241 [Trametes versicolor FP-101664 SS1]